MKMMNNKKRFNFFKLKLMKFRKPRDDENESKRT